MKTHKNQEKQINNTQNQRKTNEQPTKNNKLLINPTLFINLYVRLSIKDPINRRPTPLEQVLVEVSVTVSDLEEVLPDLIICSVSCFFPREFVVVGCF